MEDSKITPQAVEEAAAQGVENVAANRDAITTVLALLVPRASELTAGYKVIVAESSFPGERPKQHAPGMQLFCDYGPETVETDHKGGKLTGYLLFLAPDGTFRGGPITGSFTADHTRWSAHYTHVTIDEIVVRVKAEALVNTVAKVLDARRAAKGTAWVRRRIAVIAQSLQQGDPTLAIPSDVRDFLLVAAQVVRLHDPNVGGFVVETLRALRTPVTEPRAKALVAKAGELATACANRAESAEDHLKLGDGAAKALAEVFADVLDVYVLHADEPPTEARAQALAGYAEQAALHALKWVEFMRHTLTAPLLDAPAAPPALVPPSLN